MNVDLERLHNPCNILPPSLSLSFSLSRNFCLAFPYQLSVSVCLSVSLNHHIFSVSFLSSFSVCLSVSLSLSVQYLLSAFPIFSVCLYRCPSHLLVLISSLSRSYLPPVSISLSLSLSLILSLYYSLKPL